LLDARRQVRIVGRGSALSLCQGDELLYLLWAKLERASDPHCGCTWRRYAPAVFDLGEVASSYLCGARYGRLRNPELCPMREYSFSEGRRRAARTSCCALTECLV
jgi:hypothetical protein